jgi:hypothetical protein
MYAHSMFPIELSPVEFMHLLRDDAAPFPGSIRRPTRSRRNEGAGEEGPRT